MTPVRCIERKVVSVEADRRIRRWSLATIVAVAILLSLGATPGTQQQSERGAPAVEGTKSTAVAQPPAPYEASRTMSRINRTVGSW